MKRRCVSHLMLRLLSKNPPKCFQTRLIIRPIYNRSSINITCPKSIHPSSPSHLLLIHLHHEPRSVHEIHCASTTSHPLAVPGIIHDADHQAPNPLVVSGISTRFRPVHRSGASSRLRNEANMRGTLQYSPACLARSIHSLDLGIESSNLDSSVDIMVLSDI